MVYGMEFRSSTDGSPRTDWMRGCFSSTKPDPSYHRPMGGCMKSRSTSAPSAPCLPNGLGRILFHGMGYI